MSTRDLHAIAAARCFAVLCLAAPAFAQTSAPPTGSAPGGTPLHIPTRSGEVILPTPADRQNYDQYGFAAVRRAGNLVFISGVVVGRRADNSFHIWQGPNFAGDKDAQFTAFEQVKEEFMHGPKPAWTAVGTTALLPDAGIVEIQMIAAAPEKPRRAAR